jgi:hypothetical protein
MGACTRRIATAAIGTKASSLATDRVDRAAWCRPSPRTRGLGISHLIVNSGDEVFSLQHSHLDSTEPDLVTGVPGVEHLVARIHACHVASNCGDDSRATHDGRGNRCREDEARARLGLVRDGLDDDEIVERLQCDVDASRLFDHPLTIDRAERLAPSIPTIRCRNVVYAIDSGSWITD